MKQEKTENEETTQTETGKHPIKRQGKFKKANNNVGNTDNNKKRTQQKIQKKSSLRKYHNKDNTNNNRTTPTQTKEHNTLRNHPHKQLNNADSTTTLPI
ncbi:hypothetical protein CHS0354_027928 [Potamilus streckersoni]|uniref:Uncharacterized protein n=1 Tax=Potamilus streckersoni TaxID=2493646 RepID=A0AAE0WA50_9BIVA|nr:hypothetical protein CHS0354_027928 [Potamilus streckersoni]